MNLVLCLMGPAEVRIGACGCVSLVRSIVAGECLFVLVAPVGV